jgi:polyhydroxyalkanoate synthase subunit PhaC
LRLVSSVISQSSSASSSAALVVATPALLIRIWTGPLARMRDHHVDLATFPKTEVHRIGTKVLYRCQPPARLSKSPPILVTYALVGRYTILDLQEDGSLLRQLVDAGLDVYAVDWGHPTRADRFDDLGDYVDGYVDAFVDAVRERSSHDAIKLFGICQGGVLALCHAALFPEKVRILALAVTPVDFHADQTEDRPDRGFMIVRARALEPEDIELMVEGLGNLPGDSGGVAFSMMTPLRSLTKYNLTLVEVGQDEAKLLRMEKWLADRSAHPGGVARQFGQ